MTSWRGTTRSVYSNEFLSIFSWLFLKAEGYKDLVQYLFKCKTLNEVKELSYFKDFGECRYIIKISKDSLKLLKNYLEDSECRILTPIFHREFNVVVIEDHKHITVPSVKVGESTSQGTQSSENLSARNVVVKKSNNDLSSKIASYHYSISCRKEQLYCVDIHRMNILLACGFENSDIHIWNVDPEIVNESISNNLEASESNVGKTSSLSLKCVPKGRVLKGHNGGVYGVAFGPNLLMSCSGDATARAWSLTSFKDLRAYCEHKNPIWDIDVVNSCDYFVTASLDCTARMWNFNRTSPLRIFVGHSADIDHVIIHKSSKYMVTSSADKTIKLWAFDNGCSARNFSGHVAHINSIAFSPDGKHLASADDSGCIKIWDLQSGKLYGEIAAHSRKILSISYNKSDSVIALCGIDGLIKIWDVKYSLLTDGKGKSEFQTVSLVDSYCVESEPHYVSFCQKDFLMSVGTKIKIEN